ncbi:MAG: tryptophan synthase subunit alpha [Lachnospiraceae bacterium]|jgi:tryptophan synthase alpha chain|nr:tryptophan synthase subunit alpha [Lachnospiraceae bacterium]
MTRIHSAFTNKKAFIGFVTGGDPTMAASEEIILAMIEAGADLVEIGIPFSDPIAEGPVIQAANIRALKAGATTERIFELATHIRPKSDIPLVFLTYLNPVFHYGYERFFARMKAVGMDGIIVPDLPYEERGEVADIADKYDIDVITLIAPTSKQRITELARPARGFIYLVSSLGVTGVRSAITTDLSEIVATARSVTDVPVAVGFGIHTPAQAAAIADIADGVIVGSAIVKIVAEHGEEAAVAVGEYVREMKEAIDR